MIGVFAEAAWFVLFGVLFLTTLPRKPRRDTPNPDHSVGMQVLLAHSGQEDWQRPGVDATFGDLIRRRWFDVDGQEIRLGTGDGKPLDEAETEVLEHVRAVVSRARTEAAPLAALREGPGVVDKWERYARAYQTKAHELGLTQPRFAGTAALWLIGAGGFTGAWLVRDLGITNIWALIGIFFASLIAHFLILAWADRSVLTEAGAEAAGPAPRVAGPRMAAERSNAAGWTHDEQAGWRQWRLEGGAGARSAPAVDFGAWPQRVLGVASVAWAVLIIVAIANDKILVSVEVMLAISLVFYLLVLALSLGLRWHRKSVLIGLRWQFEQFRKPVTGLVVRKYLEKVYDESNTPEVTYYLVLDRGPGQAARLFTVTEEQYESVHEGQSTVRALPSWQSTDADRFELLPSEARANDSLTAGLPAGEAG